MAARLLRTTPSRGLRAEQPIQRLTDKMIAGELGRVPTFLLRALSPSARNCLRLWREAERVALERAYAVASAALVEARRGRNRAAVDMEFWRIVGHLEAA
jgi:hypothetical protein